MTRTLPITSVEAVKQTKLTERYRLTELELRQILIESVAEGNLCIVQDILSRHILKLDSRNSNGSSALHIACEKGNKDAVVMLLEHGASVRISDGRGNNIFHLAVLR